MFGVRPVEPKLMVETPVPAGATHVPSPRQKVEAEADVPLFRLLTGRLPVTSADRLTAPNVGAPVALPCNTVVLVPARVDDIALAVLP